MINHSPSLACGYRVFNHMQYLSKCKFCNISDIFIRLKRHCIHEITLESGLNYCIIIKFKQKRKVILNSEINLFDKYMLENILKVI